MNQGNDIPVVPLPFVQSLGYIVVGALYVKTTDVIKLGLSLIENYSSVFKVS